MFRKIILTVLFCVCSAASVHAEQATISVWKSQYCGCCKDWVVHLEENGFKVVAKDVDNVNAIKQKLGLTRDLASCHTGLVEGYFIEGHVPAKDIHRLLDEKPEIKGLAVPGMPAGQNVPGMETVSENATFEVLAVGEQGIQIYSKYE